MRTFVKIMVAIIVATGMVLVMAQHGVGFNACTIMYMCVGVMTAAILGVFDALDKEYIALNPLGTEDVYIYGYKDYEEDYELIDITDEEEFKKVVAEFESLVVEEA